MSPAATNRRIWSETLRTGILPFATMAIIILMVVPVPSIVLDAGFVGNIVLSLAVLMLALNAERPLDFSSFPTVLLFTTLLRLALNVASTRVVLVDGHKGASAAGHVIEAFGSFLIGGDWAVGILVFAILMIINLVVITKGAGRVSEVSARFTLDALPGKQMAIDADLNAGLMTADEAKVRRQEVATEADFYGSMDGASKFVKGDAVAGVLILLINICGGMILGLAVHGMSPAEAAERYVLLAIGDALVAQIPALLLSIAAAAIVTRVTSPLNLAGQVSTQFGNPRAWTPVAVIMTILGLLPGMPHLIILPAAIGSGALAWRLRRPRQPVSVVVSPREPSSIVWSEVSDGSLISVDLGYALVSLVDERRGAPLMARITAVRRQLSRELGFVVPLVRVRDDLTLGANDYRIEIAGVVAGLDQAWPEDLLALDPGDLTRQVEGRSVKDPTFGLDALWIGSDQRVEAMAAGYTVVDASTVIGTHLNRLITRGAHEIFGLDETQSLLDTLKESAPHLAGALTPTPFSLSAIATLCRQLLKEGVAISEFKKVSEAMLEESPSAANPSLLLQKVRQRIGALIVQQIAPARLPLKAITLATELEALLTDAVRAAGDALYPIDPSLASRLSQAIASSAASLLADGLSFAILTGPETRTAIARILRPALPDVPVLSYLEIPDDRRVEIVAVVGSSPDAELRIADQSLTEN